MAAVTLRERLDAVADAARDDVEWLISYHHLSDEDWAEALAFAERLSAPLWLHYRETGKVVETARYRGISVFHDRYPTADELAAHAAELQSPS